MGKRSNKSRRRQGDPYNHEETGTSEEEIGKKCTHLAKGLNLPQLKKVILQGFKLQECEDCVKIANSSKAEAKPETENESSLDPDKKDPVENSEIVVNEEKKEAENEEKEERGSWICLQCGHRGCGRNEQKHALSHFKIPHSSSHDLAVDSLTWMTWCYKCDDYVTVDSSRLNQAIDFIRKQSGLSGKPEKISVSIRRSQSQYDTSSSMANGFSSSNKFDSLTEKGSKNKSSVNEPGSLPPVKGLTNLGNTCFFNSVMQVLSQTHWLTQLLDLEVRDGNVAHLRGSDGPGPSCTSSCSTLSELDNCDSGVSSLLEGENHEEYTVTEPINVIMGPGKPLTLTLASFLKDMHCPAVAGGSGKHRRQSSSSSTVTPSSLFSQISKKSPQFRGSQQQDAHELLRHLLDGVRTEEITRRRHAIMNHFNLPITAVKNQPIDVDPVLKRKLKIYGKESAHTFVDQLFGGQLLSTLICETCHQPYQILEPFMDLSLPVSEDKTPPACSKRNKSAGVVDSMVCLTPSSPVLPSKSKLKKERKARRKVKGRKGDNVEVESNATPNLVEESAIESMENCATKTETETCPSEVVAVKIEEELDEEGSSSSGRDDEEDEDGGDVEDNTEEINELITEMKRIRVEVRPEQEEDSASQHQMDSVAVSGSAKKVRSEWIANSLCSLAVRYQPTNQECSVLSCLNLFTAPELLTGSNKYGCENCTKRKAAAAVAEGAPEGTKTPTVYSVASKQLLIFAPPAILTLHLKRFTQNGITLRKAQKHVEFPLRFDLASFCSAASAGVGSVRADQKEIIYSLYAVINHSGRLSQGHYTAFVKVRPVASDSLTKFLQLLPMQTDDLYRLRDQLSERLLAEKTATSSVDSGDSCPPPTASKDSSAWYYCSDSHVTTATEDQVLRSQAFLLFYERVV